MFDALYTLFKCGKSQIFENILTSDSLVWLTFELVQSLSHPQNSVVVIAVVVRLPTKFPTITSCPFSTFTLMVTCTQIPEVCKLITG
jgi:hypothetical protein